MNLVSRAAALHDISGFGRCSLTVILPVLSAMGIQCCPIPTAYLSTHTGGFSGMARVDLTHTMQESLSHWVSLGLKFDAVYTGYLSEPKQAQIAAEALQTLKSSTGLAVVDPACGDHGRLYASCTPQLWDGLARLCAHADVITPNLTEAGLLLDMDYEQVKQADPEWLVAQLSADGRKSVVLTGVVWEKNRMGAACFDRNSGRTALVGAFRYPGSWPGTGDLFSAVLTGALLQGDGLMDAAQQAVDFVSCCVKVTLDRGLPLREGVAFEPMLHRLTDRYLEDVAEKDCKG